MASGLGWGGWRIRSARRESAGQPISNADSEVSVRADRCQMEGTNRDRLVLEGR